MAKGSAVVRGFSDGLRRLRTGDSFGVLNRVSMGVLSFYFGLTSFFTSLRLRICQALLQKLFENRSSTEKFEDTVPS